MARSAEVSSVSQPTKPPAEETTNQNAALLAASSGAASNGAVSNGATAPGVKRKGVAKRSAPAQPEERAASRDAARRRLHGRLSENRARVLEHVSTLILSLVLACIVWFTAVSQENPIQTQIFTVPLEVRNVPAGLEVLDMPSMTINLTAKAPQRTLEVQTNDDFHAFVDLADAEPGFTEQPITILLPESRIEVISQEREVLTLQLDPRDQQEVRIEGRIMDGPAFGYEPLEPIITPISTTIRGPETRVEQVAEAVVEIYLDGSNNQVERPNLPIQLRDAQGNVVEGVQAEPPLATAKVPIEELPGRKEVAVRVNYVGEPARGYRLGGIKIEPSTVVLTGDDEILEDLPGFVETQPIDLFNASEDIRQRVRLQLPPGVETLESSSVLVTVSITTNEGGRTVSRVPVIKNAAEGLVASYLLDRVDVILSGPQPLLESLEEDDVRVILDVEGLLPGNHPIVPIVQVLDGLQVEEVLPPTVQVSISEEITEGDSSTPSQ